MISIFSKSKVKIPGGVIVAWYGTIVDIPDGWVLCDGENDTPDLRERFIRGANIDGDLGDFVGSDSHSHRMDFGNHKHSYTTPGHDHVLGSGTDIAAGTDYSKLTDETGESGYTDDKDLDSETENEDNIPAARKLFWIMKV